MFFKEETVKGRRERSKFSKRNNRSKEEIKLTA
jgi:hypothetical protein